MYIFFTIICGLVIAYKTYQKVTTTMCDCNTRMDNKVVIVTGANCGIGYATAEELANRGAKVILACRDENKGTVAAEEIKQKTGNKNVVFKRLDLASFKSVRAFVDDLVKTEPKVDVLINNAGMGKWNSSATEDNIAIEAQVNHFGPFLLTMLMVPLLKKSAPSRIVNVESTLHKYANLDINKLDKPGKSYWEQNRVYADAKLANMMCTNILAERLQGTGVTVNQLHPGMVNTNLGRNLPKIVQLITPIVGKIFTKTPKEGAQTSIHLAVSPELANVTGKYFVDCKETATSNNVNDKTLAEKVWDVSEKVVGLKKEEEKRD